MMVQGHGHANDPAGQAAGPDAPLHLLQLDIVSEIVGLKIFKIKNKDLKINFPETESRDSFTHGGNSCLTKRKSAKEELTGRA